MIESRSANLLELQRSQAAHGFFEPIGLAGKADAEPVGAVLAGAFAEDGDHRRLVDGSFASEDTLHAKLSKLSRDEASKGRLNAR